MSHRFVFARVVSLTGALLLGACGGGGGTDIDPAAPPAPATPGLSDPDSFLTFPNPQLQDGIKQTLVATYAQAYYAAIDPANERDTLEKWKAKNGFDSGGAQVTVVFGDKRDLGYGRRMTARQNNDCTVAVVVENFLVEPAVSYAYSTLNMDAAVAEDRRWHLGTNAIEFSPAPAGGRAYTKFFTFNATSGARELTIDMDGRGEKAMPGPCITCHGGRGDALRPGADALGRSPFPVVANSPTGQHGDVLAHMHPLEVDHLDFSSVPGFTRAEQEAAIKTLNRMVLSTYPIAAASGFPEDACRPVAAANEWVGTGAALIKNAYGGDGLPNPKFSDTYVPTAWSAAGQTSLYQNVVAPYCRACHVLRGNASQSDMDFESFAKFQAFAERIRAHAIDRGNMPLARIVYDNFVANSSAVGQLATFLEGQGFTVRDASGAVLRAGRPIADPGPNRVLRQGATTLSANMSLFATSYRWSIVSGPAGATLTNATSESPTFTTIADGTYVLELVAMGNGVDSAPAQLTIVVNNALAPAPSAIRFSDIKNVLQAAPPGGVACTSCHTIGGQGGPSIVYTNIDRNGDGIAGNATDDLWFYTEVRGRINFTDLVASPLLRKPSGNHHNGLIQPGFDTSVAPGQLARANYDLFLNWILSGAPQ